MSRLKYASIDVCLKRMRNLTYLFLGLLIGAATALSPLAHAAPYPPAVGGTGTSTPPSFGQLLVGNSSGTYSLTATSSLGLQGPISFPLSIGQGGTGLSSSPTYGQMLVGTSGGGYTLTATSSLGISGSQWDDVSGGINYAGGKVGIATSTPWGKLSLQIDPALYHALVLKGDVERNSLVVDNTGWLGLGTYTPDTIFQIVGDNNGAQGAPNITLTGYEYDETFTEPGIYFENFNGPEGATTGLQSGDYVALIGTGSIGSSGSQGSAGAILWEATQNWTSSAHGTRFQVNTVPNGATSVYGHFALFDRKAGFGTTSPWAVLSVNPIANNGSAPAFAVGSSTATSFLIDNKQHIGVGGFTPALSSCGTSPSLIRGGDNSGLVRVGTGSVSACTLTFGRTYTNAPQCMVQINRNVATTTVLTASTTPSALLITGSASNLGGTFLSYICLGNTPSL